MSNHPSKKLHIGRQKTANFASLGKGTKDPKKPVEKVPRPSKNPKKQTFFTFGDSPAERKRKRVQRQKRTLIKRVNEFQMSLALDRENPSTPNK